jgi:hypothetical protein
MAIFDSYSETNQDAGLNLNSGGTTRCGQSFTPSFGGKITNCQFYLKKTGAPVGNIQCFLYLSASQLGNNDDIPLIVPLAYSHFVDIATVVTTSYQLVTFDYTGNDQFNLIKGFTYVIAIQYIGGDVSNFLTVGYDNSAGTHSGNQSTYVSSWVANAADTCFYVIGDPVGSRISRGIVGDLKVGDGLSKSR